MNEEDRKLWTARIEDYRSSKLTGAKWAEDKGVSVHKLRYYINKFNKENKQISNQESREQQWASVVPIAQVVKSKSNNILRVTIGKATIEVASGFDKDTLKSLVEILSQC